MAKVRAMTWVVAAVLVTGCDRSEEQKADSPSGTAATGEQAEQGVVSEPVLDPEIANAVAEASEQAMAAGSAAAGGPPPDGILGKAKADAEALPGTAAKLTVGGTGEGNRLQLRGALPRKRSGRAEIAVRTGPRSALPSIEFALEVIPPKGETSSGEYAIRVVDSKLAAQQPGQIPAAVEKQVRTLEGSAFQYAVRDGNPVGSPRHELPKGAEAQLDQILQAASDLLSSVWIAMPEQAVGQGAFWMTTSRETFAGTDVVAYRMVTVKTLTPQRAELEVKTRRYSAGGSLGVDGFEQSNLRQFQGEDTAQLELVPGNSLPTRAQIKQTLLAIVEEQGRAAPVQFEARATFEFPADASAIAKPE